MHSEIVDFFGMRFTWLKYGGKHLQEISKGFGNSVAEIAFFSEKTYKGIETAKQVMVLIRDRLMLAQKYSEGIMKCTKLSMEITRYIQILACQMPRKCQFY